MELLVKPTITDFFFEVSFTEPVFDKVVGDGLWRFVSGVAKVFALPLNNIKVSSDAPSDKFIHFSKFDGPTFFDVSFGLEKVFATLSHSLSESQVLDHYTKLSQFLDDSRISLRIIRIQHQLWTDGDSAAFFKSLNPNIPSEFEKLLDGTGVYHILKVPEHELTLTITLAPSILPDSKLFLSIENKFSPNKYDSEKAFQIAEDYYEFILKGLKLQVKKGV